MNALFHETLYAFYDLRVSPVSFDVFNFLVRAERVRSDKGLDHIHVVIVSPSKERQILYEKQHPGADIPHETLYNADHVRWRFSNIILPSCRLLPSVQNVTVCDDGDLPEWILRQSTENLFPENYTLETPLPANPFPPVTIASNLGQSFQFIEASPQARQYARQWLDTRANGRKCVSITLREAPFNLEKNSDLTVWGEFVHRLRAAGHFPFIIRDIDKALDNHPPEFNGISSCPEAVFNLELRMALYEESHICAFVANGPASACWFNRNVRYLYVLTGDWVNADPPGMYRIGIEVGRTPPFANHFQKWIWAGQDADIFMDEFVALDNHIEQSRADGSYESKLDPVAENIEPMEFLAKRIHHWIKKIVHTSNPMDALEMEINHWARKSFHTRIDPLTFENVSPILSPALRKHWVSEIFKTRAEHEFTLECLKHCPPDVIKHPDIQIILGDIYLHRQDFETSKSHYLQAAIDTDSPVPWTQMGMICEVQLNDDEAIECYERAIQLDDQMSGIHYRIGKLARKKGEKIKAIQHYQLSMDSGATDQKVFTELGDMLENLNHPQLALYCYRTAMDRGNISKQLVNRIARVSSTSERLNSRM